MCQDVPAKELAEQVVKEMQENLRRNVAADKARREKDEYNGMNGVCCK